MVVSFEVQQPKDLELLLQLTKRLGIRRVATPSVPAFEPFVSKNAAVSADVTDINAEISALFGTSNADLVL